MNTFVKITPAYLPMYPSMYPSTDYSDYYIGLSRSDCAQRFSEQNLQTVLFATWMMVPELGILLTFRHQRCVAVEVIEMLEAIESKDNDDFLNHAHQHKPVTRQYAISS